MKNGNCSTYKRDFRFKISIFNNRAYFKNLDMCIAKFPFNSFCRGKPQIIVLTLSTVWGCYTEFYLRDGHF